MLSNASSKSALRSGCRSAFACKCLWYQTELASPIAAGKGTYFVAWALLTLLGTRGKNPRRGLDLSLARSVRCRAGVKAGSQAPRILGPYLCPFHLDTPAYRHPDSNNNQPALTSPFPMRVWNAQLGDVHVWGNLEYLRSGVVYTRSMH